MGFFCYVFDIEGSYVFEYMIGFVNILFVKSDLFYVYWDCLILFFLVNKIFLCKILFIVFFK